MTTDKDGRCTSPIHVHVEESTPVHVHVKKPKKPTMKQEAKLTEAKQTGTSGTNIRRSVTSKSRSKSPGRNLNHWVPPPAKASSSHKYAWQGPSHRLEVSSEDHDVRVEPDETDDEEKVTSKMRKYEKTIDNLMTEVGTLKNEVELQRSHHELQRRGDELESSQVVLKEQEVELDTYRRELEATEVENRILRRSMEWMKEDATVVRSDRERLDLERDVLMRKLVEVELDGQAAAQQVAALRDVIRRLREEKHLSSTDSQVLSKQKDLLVERLADFEGTNRSLRQLLRQRHEDEAAGLRLSDQRDMLVQKLTETEDRVQVLRRENLDKERHLQEAMVQLTAQHEETITLSGLQSSLETTRAHLQKQLRQKEGDCNRMAVQIRSLESQLAQERLEVDHLTQLLNTAKHKAEHDKEALKKATRVQKQRANKSEDALEQLNAQLIEREQRVSDIACEMEGLRTHLDKMSKEKAQSVAENTALKTRVSELESVVLRMEEDSKMSVETVHSRLQDKTSEATTYKLDNDRLKVSLATLEDRLVQMDTEMSQMRNSMRKSDTLIEEYRGQINKSRREADDTMLQLEDQRRETSRVVMESESEIDKVEQQQDKLGSCKEKITHSHESNRSLEAKLENVERKLHDIDGQNRELLQTISKREETIHHTTVRLDERGHENSSLQRQLEAALAESRRQTDSVRDKAAAKERGVSQRLADIESQLSQARAENARLQREKDEAERRFNARLYDLKDRLEQSHSTNRSMQNYVHFLKASYANVFGDTSFSTPGAGAAGSRGASTFH